MQNTPENKSFIVYQASAGSGKTYTLAKEYIKICLLHFPKDHFIYRKILAITFTNKAVNEMKERILLFLEMLSSGKESDLLNELSEFVDKQDIVSRSGQLLDFIHHDYSNFSICTIDSLFQRIVQNFAIDLKIPLNHQLELDTDSMMSQIVDLILSKLGYDEDITEAIVNFSFSNIESEKNWRIEQELASIGKQIYNETAIPYLKKIENIRAEDFSKIIKEINARIAVIEKSIKNWAQKACQLITDNAIAFDSFYQGKKGIGQWFYKKSKGDFDKLSGNSYILKAVNEDVWYSSACEYKDAIDSISNSLRDSYLEIAKQEQDYLLLQAIRKNIYPVALLNEIRRTAEELKHTDKLLHISEANITIAETVQNEPVPFVYERIGERYKYIFIDEFQDTSLLQWQNLLPLVVETLSAVFQGDSTGKAILFGDAKQAIYRFRGGDVRQFVALPKVNGSEEQDIIRERENALSYNFKEEFLQKNYRSKKEVVEFNNSFFAWLVAKKEERIQDIYLHVAQQAREDNVGGAVFFTCFQKDNPQKYNELALEEILRNIHYAKDAAYSYSDMAVLIRGNDFGAEIARYLLENNIPTISAESLLLFKNREISFLIACLSYLLDAQNEIARGIMLNFIAEEQNLSKEKILPFGKKNADFLKFVQGDYLTGDCFVPCNDVTHKRNSVIARNEAISNEKFSQTQGNGYNFNPQQLSRQNLYERVELLLQIFNLTKEANPFILAFLDVVADFSQKPNKTEFQFLDYWNENKHKFSLSNPKGIDAVTVMTIHQSKGLEFPVVIYPHKKPRQGSKEQWVELPEPIGELSATLLKPKSMEGTVFAHLYEEEKLLSSIDDLNIEYVSFTRAKDRLYFIAQQGDNLADEMETFLQANQQIEPEPLNPLKGTLKIADNQFSPSGVGGDYQQFSQDQLTAYYCFGNPLPKSETSDNKAAISTNYITDYISVPIGAHISTNNHDNFWEKNAKTDMALWGTKVHDYLAKVFYKEDINFVITSIQSDIEMDSTVKNNLISIFNNVFSHPQSDILFGDTQSIIQNETEIIDSQGKSFRIDRLCSNDKKYTLFEYKTGIEKEDHKTQIQQYEQLLTDAGYEVAGKYLVYIGEDLSVKFDRV
jgi:ATP-dependent exoDNAse (exonuclease V) beta subunit